VKNNDQTYKTTEALQKELEEQKLQLEELQRQLEEANDTIEAIRTGQIDALVVHGVEGHQLYTLRTADQTYRVFIEKMTEGAVTLNKEGIILYSNSQFASMVNTPLSQVIGFPFNQFIAPQSMAYYDELFDHSWNADIKAEVSLVAGKSDIPVQLSLTALELEGGIALSIILTDLTAQKQTQLQLEKNNKQLAELIKALEASNNDLQQFASVASHDLQEPLRKITIFSHLLKDRETGLSNDATTYLRKIIESAKRMRNLIMDILNYSRLSASDTPTECVDLNRIIDDLKDDFELVIEEKGAHIDAGELPCVQVNGGQIRQVFYNIVSNALKFSKPGKPPVISITSKRIADKSFTSEDQSDGPFCLISICDNGIGFDEQYLSKIFALFERLNSKDKYEGTGIGMAIAKKIIDKHNGLITAESKHNCGAEFKIILPVKQAPSSEYRNVN
jgi:signal transduction histidine kinase